MTLPSIIRINVPVPIIFKLKQVEVMGELLYYVPRSKSICRVDNAVSKNEEPVPQQILDCLEEKYFSSLSSFANKAKSKLGSLSGMDIVRIYYDGQWNEMASKTHKENKKDFDERYTNTMTAEAAEALLHNHTTTNGTKRKESPNKRTSPRKRLRSNNASHTESMDNLSDEEISESPVVFDDDLDYSPEDEDDEEDDEDQATQPYTTSLEEPPVETAASLTDNSVVELFVQIVEDYKDELEKAASRINQLEFENSNLKLEKQDMQIEYERKIVSMRSEFEKQKKDEQERLLNFLRENYQVKK